MKPTQPETRTGPLAGLKVVDISAAVSGPWASSQLAAGGADVVLVERVDSPDVMRLTGAVRGGHSGAWVAMHGSKRGIELDIRDDRGRAVIDELVTEADVFIQNFRPGVADRLGVGFGRLCTLNPRLIYASISGYGPDGPYADQPVYDPIIQGLSGLAAAQNGDFVKSFIVDKVTAMTAANAILAALLSRSASGEGQHVEVNLLDSMLSWMWPDIYWNEALPDAEPTLTYSDWYAPYKTADGYITANWTSFRQYIAAAGAVGRSDLADDERFATRAGRIRNGHAMRAEFGAALAPMTSEAALESLRAADVPCGPVLSRDEVLSDPQVIHNDTIVDSHHPTAGRVRTVKAPARFSETPAAPLGPAPGLGEHTDEVLREVGLSDADIAELRNEGIIGVARS